MAGKYTTPAIRYKRDRVIPSGYVLGRVSTGEGDVELIPIDQLSIKQVQSGIIQQAGSTGPTIYDLGFTLIDGTLLAYNTYFYLGAVSKAFKLPSATATASATCQVASLSSTVTLYLVKNSAGYEADLTTGILATITFTAGNLTGTVSWAGGTTTLARGDVLRLYVGPNVTDNTISGIELLLPVDIA